MSERLGGISVKVLLCDRPIKLANTYRPQLVRLEIACIDTHSRTALWNDGLPVGYAPAVVAPDEPESLWTPSVRRCGARLRGDVDFFLFVVRPESAIPSADGAVAIGQGLWPARILDSDCTAMAGCADHRGEVASMPPNEPS